MPSFFGYLLRRASIPLFLVLTFLPVAPVLSLHKSRACSGSLHERTRTDAAFGGIFPALAMLLFVAASASD